MNARRTNLILAVICFGMAVVVPIMAMGFFIAGHPDKTRSQAEMLFDYANEKLSLAPEQWSELSAGVREVHNRQDVFTFELRLIYPAVFLLLGIFHIVCYVRSPAKSGS